MLKSNNNNTDNNQNNNSIHEVQQRILNSCLQAKKNNYI